MANDPTEPDSAGHEQIPLDDALPADPAAEALRLRAEAAERDRDDYLRLLKEKQAEFENYQKRASQTREQERRFAALPLAAEILNALDTLEMAIQSAKQSGEGGQLAAGVEGTHRQFLDALRRFGVEPMRCQGEPFDPNRHEAVSQQPTAEVPPGHVVQIFRQGYTIHERVLRPASVVVSAAPAGESAGGEAGEQEGG